MTFFYDLNKKLATIADKPETQQLNERDMSRAAKGYEKYGKEGMEALAKAGREGKALDPIRNKYDKYNNKEVDEGLGDMMATAGAKLKGLKANITKNPADRQAAIDAYKGIMKKEYNKMRDAYPNSRMPLSGPGPSKRFDNAEQSAAMHKIGLDNNMEEGLGDMARKVGGMAKEEYGPMEGGAKPMTPKQKSFAKLAPPADKITFADKIAGAKKEVDEMLGDVAAEAMKGALRGGQKKLDRNHNGRLDAQDFAMLRAGKGKQETDEGWDDMLKDVEKRRQMKPGDKIQGAKGEIEKTATGVKHTRRYDPKSGETDTGDDTAPAGEKRGRGRPKGSGKAIGAKGPSGKSKLLAREDDHDSDEVKQAMAVLKKAGYKISKGEQELDEKAVSQNQAIAARIARGVQKGEVKAKKGSASAEMAKMEPKELKKFAKTDTKGLPKKKGKEEVEETAAEAPKASKGGMQFGKGIYDSMNRELEQMIAESMNISMNMSNDQHGGPSKSLTVTATDEDAVYLGKLLKMAGVGGGEGSGCGCGQQPCACNSAEQVDENQPDWPTNTETSDDALQYSGGLNKPKTTVAGDGQTTVPVTAVQVREDEEELDEQEQVMAPESREEELDEEIKRMREMAGLGEAAKPDYIDLDRDGNRKESMKKAAADAEKDKKVKESILDMTRLWKAYKG